MLFLLLRLWAMNRTVDPWQSARDEEDREIQADAEKMLRRAERRQVNNGRRVTEPMARERTPNIRNKYARRPSSRDSDNGGLVALAIVGGVVAFILLGCGGVFAVMVLMASLSSPGPVTVASNAPRSNTLPNNVPVRQDNNPPNNEPIRQDNKPPEPAPNPWKEDKPFRELPGGLPASLQFADAPADLPPVQERDQVLSSKQNSSADRELQLNAVALTTPSLVCWTPDATGFYLVQKESGIVSRITLDGVKEKRRLSTGRTCSGACLSALGLLLTFPAHHECWLVDADTLQVKLVVRIPNIERVLSAPVLAKAFVFCSDKKLITIDLEKRAFKGPLAVPALSQPVLTSDGNYLFAGKDRAIQRYRVEGDNFIFEEAGPDTGGGAEGSLCVSSDGRFVSWCWGGGSNGQINGQQLPTYSTLVFSGTALKKPLFAIRQGAYPRLVAFDAKTGRVFAPNYNTLLMVFDGSGTQERSYKRESEELGRELQFLVHPDGNQVVLLFEKHLLVGAWRKQ